MRRAALVLLLVAGVALAAEAILAAREQRTLAFTLGVASDGVAATLAPGQEVCQRPVPVGAAFDAVQLRLASGGGGAAAPLAVTIRPEEGGAPLARGTLPAGAADGAAPTVRVGPVPERGAVAICVRNVGAHDVGLLGAPDYAVRGSTALLDGQLTGQDLELVLRRTEARSTLALLPDALRRAALFRGAWSGAWLYWALLAAVVLGVPALLVRALMTTARPSAADAGSPPPPPAAAAAPRSGDRGPA